MLATQQIGQSTGISLIFPDVREKRILKHLALSGRHLISMSADDLSKRYPHFQEKRNTANDHALTSASCACTEADISLLPIFHESQQSDSFRIKHESQNHGRSRCVPCQSAKARDSILLRPSKEVKLSLSLRTVDTEGKQPNLGQVRQSCREKICGMTDTDEAFDQDLC